jgi:phosphoesterase RecJ-like protein
MTDTGGFRFSNTTSTVLSVCAKLAEKGADCSEIYRRVYACDSAAGLKLKSRIWSTLFFAHDNRICVMEMPQRLIEELGAEYGDSEGMADFTITADGVEVGILIKYSDSRTHFSLRSAGRIDVGKIARSIKGGGGHTNAAGCTLNMPLDEAKKEMLEILSRELRSL